MYIVSRAAVVTAAIAVLSSISGVASADRDSLGKDRRIGKKDDQAIQLGPRPFYLVEGMDEGPLKDELMKCKGGPFYRTQFSIGHRGAALQFPEHTREAYDAGARMGAGIVECDVTFTKNGDFVCRHAQNDLHTTTNILMTPLASTCIKPFAPATLDAKGKVITPASAECRTSELTLDEFKSLKGKMDVSRPAAKTVEDYVGGTASWRTDVYTGRGTLMTLRESIELNERNGVKHTPELKSGDPALIKAIFGGQDRYAQKLADELQAAGVKPRDAWPQSFNLDDILHWIDHTPYGSQAVYLLDFNDKDPVNDVIIQPPYDKMDRGEFLRLLKKRGVRIIAPAMPALLAVDGSARITPSKLAKDLRAEGFEIITWTFERSDLRRGASKAGFYYDFDADGKAIKKDSDMYKALDVLAREVKILGIFSDWPATVTYYANCMGIR